ncbi:MAG: hypothetical protein Q9173_004684 [Seirophora scorigena]
MNDYGVDGEIEMLDVWMDSTEDKYDGYLRSRMLKKRQRSLDAWRQRHVCDARCKEVSKGRAAIRPGLPLSTTHGLWKVLQVDLYEFYGSTDPDDPLGKEHTDTEGSADENEDDVAEQRNSTDAESDDAFPTC